MSGVHAIGNTARLHANLVGRCVKRTFRPAARSLDATAVSIGSTSATELIEQFKALPATERAQVAKFVVEHDDSWVPEFFRDAMADLEAGRVVDLDQALDEPYDAR